MRLRYRICRSCGLVYMTPRPSQDAIEAFYQEEYRQSYCGQAQPTESDLAIQRGRAEHLASIVVDAHHPIHSHLDIGCSSGALLLAVRDRLPGTTSAGVEPSDGHREHARSTGMTVHPSLDSSIVPDGGFDLVTLSHVLEHVPNPVSFLVDVRTSYLAKDGLLLVEVPNLLGHMCFEVAHLTCFHGATFKNTLRAAGFEVITYKEHDVPRVAYRRQYLTALARPASSLGKPDRVPSLALVQWKRRRALSRHRWPLVLAAWARDSVRSTN